MKRTQSSFDPETLNHLRRAYEDALAELNRALSSAGGTSADADAQTLLASRVMALAATGERDAAALKRYALLVLDPSASDLNDENSASQPFLLTHQSEMRHAGVSSQDFFRPVGGARQRH